MADSSIPVICIHRGDFPYLPFVLGQAEMANPDSPIILIGDQTDNVVPMVNQVPIDRHWEEAARLDPVYRRQSPRPTDPELFCLSRWFVLRDYMRANGLEQVFHLESDVMLYADVNQEHRHWFQYDLTMVRSCFGGSMFVNGLAGLDELCQSIWDMLSGRDASEKLRSLYGQDQHAGHACETMP